MGSEFKIGLRNVVRGAGERFIVILARISPKYRVEEGKEKNAKRNIIKLGRDFLAI
jgi:hypothetical protein